MVDTEKMQGGMLQNNCGIVLHQSGDHGVMVMN